MKKSVYIGIAIITLIIIAICLFAFTKNNKKEMSTNANVVEENKQEENEIINEQENEIIQNEIENTIENTIVNEVAQNEIENTASSETFEEEPAKAEEKAIDIVKKDWKEIDNTKITVEGMNEKGQYIVVIRDSKTTEALAFYSVDVANKTFTKREMN